MLTTNNYPRRCRTGGTSVFGITSPGISSSRSKLPLRSYYKPRNTLNLTHIENAPFGRPKRFKLRKMSAFQKMDTPRKKIPDYTETAYREAVARLKYLLAESYTPRSGKISREKNIYRRSNTKLHESADETDERSISDICSKDHLSTNLLSRTNTFNNRNNQLQLVADSETQLTPKELSTLVLRQEEYIEQLESESQFCRDELKNLLGKIREVVAENEALHDKNKSTLLKSFLNEFDGVDDTKRVENKAIKTGNNLSDMEASTPGKKMKLQSIADAPSIIFESRISELEAQLTQARIELRKAQEDHQMNAHKMSEGNLVVAGPETTAQLDQVMREKREIGLKLEEALKNIETIRGKESEASQKAKRALDSAQQAEFERNQAESEIRRLKDELERQREKIREVTQETCRRLAEERHQVERRYSQQVEQMSADIATHWNAASKSQLEIEKQRREIGDLKRELSQKQAMIDDLKKEIQMKTSNLQSEINQIAAEKDAVEQELATAKLTAERNDRHARQEQNRWQSEINSYKQRLERADADIVHCRRENLRLTEQIASLEKELNMEKIIRGGENKITAVAATAEKPTPRAENDKDITSMIMDMETKHAATVAGLEDSLSNQAKLVSRLTAECQSLTQRLEATNRTHKEEMASLQNNIEFLTNKFKESIESQKGNTAVAGSTQEDELKINQNTVNDNTNQQYASNDAQNYPHNYDDSSQNKNQDPPQYALEGSENYQEYDPTQDPNYQGQYTNEDYQQYDQYDPSLYQQVSSDGGQNPNSQLDQQQYENYAGNDYVDNQHESVTQDQQFDNVNANPDVS